MHIDIDAKRADYFTLPSVSSILRTSLPDKANITVRDLVDHNDKCLVATLDNDLETLINRNYETSYDDVFDAAHHMQEDTLLVLPPDYRVEKPNARRKICYSNDTLTRLDDKRVVATVADKDEADVEAGPLPAHLKQRYSWTPDNVIDAARRNPGEVCHAWWGKDRHRRVVSLYRAIEGSELRTFSLFASMKERIGFIEEQLHGNRSQGHLSEEQAAMLGSELRRKRGYIERIGRENLLHLRYAKDDAISFGRPFGKGIPVTVPSRSRPGRPYEFNLTSIPYTMQGSTDCAPVWELRGQCHCKDKQYHGYRRQDANDDDFFCAHEIAGFHRLRRGMRDVDVKGKDIRYLPFIIPSKGLMDFVDTLRYKTIMLTFNDDTARWSKRRLNHTEMEMLITPYLAQENSNVRSTPDMERFIEQGYDPIPELIKV